MSLPLRPPLIVHHMAALDDPAVRFPPNSLEAIRACLDAGAAFIEIDITALADADYLLVHDPTLESETTGQGEVGACSLAASAGLYFKGADGAATPYRVPRLGEVVALMTAHPATTRIQLDFKNVFPFADDEPLRRLVRLVEPLGSCAIVSSGADWQLRRMRRLAPWLELGLDVHYYIDLRGADETIDPRIPPYRLGAYGYWDDHPLATARFYSMAEYLWDRCATLAGLVPGATTFYINHHLITRSLDDGFNWAEAAHEHGIRLDAWTMDAHNPAAAVNAPRLLAAGVDQFTTNTPTALAALLAV
jgi:glycerophosphoryl diester phosphodiesterase